MHPSKRKLAGTRHNINNTLESFIAHLTGKKDRYFLTEMRIDLTCIIEEHKEFAYAKLLSGNPCLR